MQKAEKAEWPAETPRMCVPEKTKIPKSSSDLLRHRWERCASLALDVYGILFRISWPSSCCVVSCVSSFSFGPLHPPGLGVRLGTPAPIARLYPSQFFLPSARLTASQRPQIQTSRIARIDRILHDRALGVAFFRLSSFLTLLNLRDHALESLADVLVVARARFGEAAA